MLRAQIVTQGGNYAQSTDCNTGGNYAQSTDCNTGGKL